MRRVPAFAFVAASVLTSCGAIQAESEPQPTVTVTATPEPHVTTETIEVDVAFVPDVCVGALAPANEIIDIAAELGQMVGKFGMASLEQNVGELLSMTDDFEELTEQYNDNGAIYKKKATECLEIANESGTSIPDSLRGEMEVLD